MPPGPKPEVIDLAPMRAALPPGRDARLYGRQGCLPLRGRAVVVPRCAPGGDLLIFMLAKQGAHF